LSLQKVYEMFLKATVLALILTIPPIVGLFLIWHYGDGSALLIAVWTIGAVFWNIVVLILFIKGRLFKEGGSSQHAQEVE
jgi:hypothetical protein